MLEIKLDAVPRLDSIGRKLRVATVKKLTQLTEEMYDKVIENLSGKILQKQSGDLAGSVRWKVTEDGDSYTGLVFISPETPKAYVLEKGGQGFYEIYPTKASVLAWVNKGGEKVFAKRVWHPPSKEFAYLRIAAEEMADLVPEGFKDAIVASLSDGAFE